MARELHIWLEGPEQENDAEFLTGVGDFVRVSLPDAPIKFEVAEVPEPIRTAEEYDKARAALDDLYPDNT